jgi:hypothetical protein
MHRVDALNYVTNSGLRQFKDSPIPGTTWSANEANAWQEELAQLVEGAGLTLAASSAADQSAGWNQVLQAVKRLAKNITAINVVMDEGPNKNLGLTLDTYSFRITEDPGGDEVDGNVYIETTANLVGKFILIQNGTSSRKFIQLNQSAPMPAVYPLLPGQAMAFLGMDDGASGAMWSPMDSGFATTYVISATWRIGVARTVFKTADIKVTKFALNRLVHWDIPQAFAVTIPTESGSADPTFIDITAAGDAGFPADLYPFQQNTYDGFVRLNDAFGNGVAGIWQTRTERYIRIFPLDGSDIPAGNGAIGAIRFTAALY